jgi:cytochrome c-type biogenesis protein CcmH
VLEFVVERYGEYVLLRPLTTGSNMVLYLAGPAMFLVAGTLAFAYLRRRRPETAGPVADLTDAEKRRLAEILRD